MSNATLTAWRRRDTGDRCRWSDPSDLAVPNPTDPTTGTS
jgi:hypothetical protein